MSDAVGVSVGREDLTVLAELGAGGQGRVMLVEVPAAGPEPLAYKEYPAATLAGMDAAALGELVAVPDRADGDLRTLLRTGAAWPIATVHRDDGTVCGFLMAAAPADFAVELKLGPERRSQLLAMEFLLNPPEYMAAVELPVTERMRVGLLHELARILGVLHGGRIVIGDLSPKNILVRLEPPRCFLLDCDAMRVSGRSVLPQLETPDWALPPGEDLATEAGDRYKFGLLAVRLLLADQSAGDPAGLSPVMAPVADLATRALGGPDGRPDWAEWTAALQAVLPLASVEVPVRPAQPVSAPSSVPRLPPLAMPNRPVPRRSRRGVLVGVLVAVILLVAGIVAAVNHSGGTPVDDDTTGAAIVTTTATAVTEQPTTDTPPPPPSSAGVVDISAAGDDPQTADVAEFLDRYFTAVNAKDWDTLLGYYDPAGKVDNTDAQARSTFIHNMSTTRESDVHLLGVDSSVNPVEARLTFVSHQSSGYGPAGHTSQTCTRWSLTFQLTGSPGDYLLYRSAQATPQSC